MPIFIVFTRISPEGVRSSKALEELEEQAMARIRQERFGVEWVGSYAVLGPGDDDDVFRADSIEAATKVSTLIRTSGHVQAEIWRRDGVAAFQGDRPEPAEQDGSG